MPALNPFPCTVDEANENQGIIKDACDAHEAAILELQKSLILAFRVSSTGVDDYAITLNPAPSSLSQIVGVPLLMKADVPNTVDAPGATLTVNGLAATAITKQGTAALVAGDIAANEIVTLVYDGTNFQLVGK
jgi:hypothetical protein